MWCRPPAAWKRRILAEHRYRPEQGEIDLVLLDYHMDDISGFEVLKRMKEDYGLRSVPVIMLSGLDDDDIVANCIAAGADDFLPRPIDNRLLQARVVSSLSKARASQHGRRLNDQLQRAKRRTDDLLYKVFPYTVAEELITSGTVKPRGCENVAVMFCDVVGFTSYCSGRQPDEVVRNLDELFSKYEVALRKTGVERIKTIGDCLMATAGLTTRHDNPALACVDCGIRLLEAAKSCTTPWDVRVGIHVGPVVAGMAGSGHYAFDIWGDTVNTASRVQSAAEPGTICLSERAWSQVFEQCQGRSLGLRALKGKSEMESFRFESRRAAHQPGKAELEISAV